MNNNDIVQKRWNLCDVLRGDGISRAAQGLLLWGFGMTINALGQI
ncbi:hypothetical protein [uncultured Deefgea sp.]|nr:hypothetical protein [uncultured Deefgea sp.]